MLQIMCFRFVYYTCDNSVEFTSKNKKIKVNMNVFNQIKKLGVFFLFLKVVNLFCSSVKHPGQPFFLIILLKMNCEYIGY